jgi:hypothetical protein
MFTTSLPFAPTYRTNTAQEDVIQEHRARMAFEEESRQVKRREAQARQCEPSTAPGIRVRAWEKLHGLRLPSDLGHPIITIIAAQTNLTLAEVREEQYARGAKRE